MPLPRNLEVLAREGDLVLGRAGRVSWAEPDPRVQSVSIYDETTCRVLAYANRVRKTRRSQWPDWDVGLTDGLRGPLAEVRNRVAVCFELIAGAAERIELSDSLVAKTED
jgi:hypothetical protein